MNYPWCLWYCRTGVSKCAAHFVLSDKQKVLCIAVCRELKNKITWCHLHLQGHNWRWIMDLWLWPRDKVVVIAMDIFHPTRPIKVHKVHSNIKSILTVFFDIKGIGIGNLSCLVWLSLKSFTKLCSNWGTTSTRNVHNSGRKSSVSCIMTMPLSIH